MGILSGAVLFVQPARAQSPGGDLPCRGSHGENERAYTLPSGETLPLLVPLDALDASVHNYAAEAPVYCRNCHTGRERYLYPHESNPAQTQHEFAAGVSANCETRHYPHLPFHDAEYRCVACHGVTAGLYLDTYEGVLAGGNLGPAIVPGSAGESLLVQLQREGHPNSLAPRELEWIIEWTDIGAPESAADTQAFFWR